MNGLVEIEACMNQDQLEAHHWLMSQDDIVSCQREARIRLSACEHYVRRFYGLSRTLGCIGCERYQQPAGALPKEYRDPMLSPNTLERRGKSDMLNFKFGTKEVEDARFSAKSLIQRAAEERKQKRTMLAIKRGDKRFEKRKATFEAKEKERKLRLADLGKLVEQILAND